MPRNDDRDERARAVLEGWFIARDRGESPDLLALCEGDEELADRLRGLLADDPLAPRAGVPDPEPPRERIGDFRLLESIGAGGMGRVYVAEQVSLGRLVALKVIDRRGLADDAAGRRFTREAGIAAALDHPAIVPIYGVGTEGDFSWIAMKFLTGPGLDALEAPLPAAEVARIGATLARALEEAHLSGVVHRDIKPGNVILDDGSPCLVDFGLARARTDLTVTRKGVVPGTLPYMAPEQLEAGRPGRDPRSDIYSLGATLYEAVSGRPPFEATEPQRLIRAIILKDPPPLELSGTDRDLETVILRALEKEPDRRFASAGAMADELEQVARGEPIRSRRSGPLTRMILTTKRHRRAAAALGVLLVAALALLGVLVARMANETRRFDAKRRETARAIDAGEFSAAQALVGSLLTDRPDDEGARRLARRLDGISAYQELVDVLLDRSSIHNRELIERLAARMRRNEALAEYPRYGRLALAVAALCLDERDEARTLIRAAELSGGGPGRATIALRAAVDRRESVELPETPGRSADEHVFAELALRLIYVPFARREHEIRAAIGLEQDHYRARFALAHLRAEARLFDEAWIGFVCLERPDRPHPALRTNLAHIAILRGEMEEAARQLAAIPEDRRGPIAHLLEASVHRHLGHDERADAVLRAARERWPDHSDVLLRHASRADAAGRPEEARELAERALARSLVTSQREMARAMLLEIELCRVLGNESEPADPLDLEDLEDEARREAESMRYAPARALARTTEATAAFARRRYDEAFDRLRRAIADDPRAHRPRKAFLDFTYRLLSEGGTKAQDIPQLLSEALQHAEEFFVLEERLRSHELSRSLHVAWAQVAVLEHGLGRDAAARKSAARARAALPAGGDPVWEPLIATLLRAD